MSVCHKRKDAQVMHGNTFVLCFGMDDGHWVTEFSRTVLRRPLTWIWTHHFVQVFWLWCFNCLWHTHQLKNKIFCTWTWNYEFQSLVFPQFYCDKSRNTIINYINQLIKLAIISRFIIATIVLFLADVFISYRSFKITIHIHLCKIMEKKIS